MKCQIVFASFCIALTHFQAQAALPAADVETSSIDEVITLARPQPESENEMSEIYESAPEEMAVGIDPQFASNDEAGIFSFFNQQQKQQTAKGGAARGRVTTCHSNEGKASFYWQPQKLASGGRFNPNELTAAHKHLPFGTQVRVTNMSNGRSVVVKINDRGPYVGGRIIDLSKASFAAIAPLGQGVARVRIQTVNCN